MHHLYLPAMAADILKTSVFCHVGLHTALRRDFMRGTLACISQNIRRASILALALGGIVTLCTGSSRAVAADDTIKIGVVLPTTGSESKPGAYQKEGIELAIKQIN